MAETGIHVLVILFLYDLLREHFAKRTDVYVAANMFLYYEEGNPRANKAPDVMVIMGVGNHERRIFKTWEEGAVPSTIIEVTSKKTRKEDQTSKPAVYAQVGVAEYFLFDPLDEYLKPRFQGYRLEGHSYLPMAPEPDGGLTSAQLGVRLIPEGQILRVVNARTGQRILTSREKSEHLEMEAKRRKREQRRAQKERRRAEALAGEVRRLRRLLKRQGRRKETR